MSAVEDFSGYQNSQERLDAVLTLLLDGVWGEGAPPEIFWAGLMQEWTACDATWGLRSDLLASMRENGSGIPHHTREQRRFFNSLPNPVPIYRGCYRGRESGMARQWLHFSLCGVAFTQQISERQAR